VIVIVIFGVRVDFGVRRLSHGFYPLLMLLGPV